GLLDLERTLLETRGERLAFKVLDDEICDALLVTDVEKRADVRMIQRRDEARLTIEAFAQRGIACELRRQDLDRDRSIEPRITGAIHLAHTARADGCLDFVGTEPTTGSQQWGCANYRNGTWGPPLGGPFRAHRWAASLPSIAPPIRTRRARCSSP